MACTWNEHAKQKSRAGTTLLWKASSAVREGISPSSADYFSNTLCQSSEAHGSCPQGVQLLSAVELGRGVTADGAIGMGIGLTPYPENMIKI